MTTSQNTSGFYSTAEVSEKKLLGNKSIRSIQRMCKLGRIPEDALKNVGTEENPRYMIKKSFFE